MQKPTQDTVSGTTAIVFTFLVLGFFIYLYMGSKPLQTTAQNSQQSINKGVKSAQYSSYVNATIDGGQVLSCINSIASKEVTVIVKTLKNSSGASYNGPNYNITDITDEDYIEVTGTFKSTVTKTDNGTVNIITLTQQ